MFARSLTLALVATYASAAVEADRVTSLPNMAVFDTYPVYSGYVDLPNTTKRIHYMFVESQSVPSTDPLIIWFNGGPGCSSMLGWAQEHGPYLMHNGDTNWVSNPYSWNTAANVLYIEQPAGVGFSYCGTPEDCTFNDETAADDNLVAVLEWFNLYPEFGTNPLYISGESYAGVYVPYLSKRIYDYNVANAADPNVFKPNLIGFAVGNGVTNWNYDCTPAQVDLYYWHSIMSDDMRIKMENANCDFSGYNFSNATAACISLYESMSLKAKWVNIYNIYGICYGTSIDPQLYETEGQQRKGWTACDYTPWVCPNSGLVEEDPLEGDSLPPCTYGIPLMNYFDDATVRADLHIDPNVGAWNMCTGPPAFNYTSLPQASQWIYEELYGKIRMMHFSGDVDGAVPTIGTQNWIDSLNWTIQQPWTEWDYAGQVAGWSIVYENDFTFITVHGSGHMVPEDKPAQAHKMLYNWINQVPL